MNWIKEALGDYTFEQVQIKGKDYTPVAEKVNALFQCGVMFSHYPNTEFRDINGDQYVYIEEHVTFHHPEDATKNIISVGTAMEKIGEGMINKTSAVENCQTSALGRAFSTVGIGVTNDIASADEIAKSMRQENTNHKLNDERLFSELLEHENSQIRDICNQILIMSKEDYPSKIKLLNELTKIPVSETKKKKGGKDWMVEDFTKLLNIYEGSKTNERYRETLEMCADRVNMAFNAYEEKP